MSLYNNYVIVVVIVNIVIDLVIEGDTVWVTKICVSNYIYVHLAYVRTYVLSCVTWTDLRAMAPTRGIGQKI